MKIEQKAVNYIVDLGAVCISDVTVECLQDIFPELDEIPGMIEDKISE